MFIIIIKPQHGLLYLGSNTFDVAWNKNISALTSHSD